MTNRKLWLVAQGVVVEYTGQEPDGIASVLAYADSADSALDLATSYDDGDIQEDNVTVNGVTVGALCQAVES